MKHIQTLPTNKELLAGQAEMVVEQDFVVTRVLKKLHMSETGTEVESSCLLIQDYHVATEASSMAR